MRKLVVNARFEETLAGWSQRRVALGAISRGLQAGGIRVRTPNNVVPLPFNPLRKPTAVKVRAALPATPQPPRRNPKGAVGVPLVQPPKRKAMLALPPASQPDAPQPDAPYVPPADSNLPPLEFNPPAINTPPASGGSSGGGSSGGSNAPAYDEAYDETPSPVTETAADLAPVLITEPAAPTPASQNKQVLIYAGLAALAYFVFIRKA